MTAGRTACCKQAKTSAIEGAVREHRIEEPPPFGERPPLIREMGAFREF
jgi:hypothetical protein